MPRVPLVGAAYTSRSVIAAAQESINLYSEKNDPRATPPVPATCYPTPGLNLQSTPPYAEAIRTLYTASNGSLYGVIGPNVYAVSDSYDWTLLGSVPDRSTPVSFSDNGLVILLVDGSSDGWAIKMSDNTFGSVSATNFYGGTTVIYQDTFFILNRPDTAQFYISVSNADYSMLTGGTGFDALDIAAKSTADPIVAVAAVHGEAWLIGSKTTEPWYDSGAADFAYQRIQGAFVNHGCAAPYSVAVIDNSLLCVSQDQQGNGVVVMSDGYAFKRVSPHAIEQEIQGYATISDAIGYCYQEDGHAFYVLTFPTADVTWVYDIGEDLWHRRVSIDGNGVFHRHRSNCFAFAYAKNLVGDYQNGSLYEMTLTAYTDNGVSIPRIRRFPHLVQDGNRIVYRQFQADLAAGQIPATLIANAPQIFLRWSDDKGFSYGNAVGQSMGASGQYLTSPNWQRLGMARDRVFEVSWSAATNTALNGCWINVVPAAT